jgi:hypothetical protein
MTMCYVFLLLGNLTNMNFDILSENDTMFR